MNHLVKIIMAAALFSPLSSVAADWAPAGDNIMTPWAEKVSPANVHPEYPRPQLRRTEWKSLNGLWDYAVAKSGAAQPNENDGQILVPFAIESALSGVRHNLAPDEALWYNTEFEVPKEWKGKRVALNFGAVDWRAEVYLNGILLGTHTGGYTNFSFDLTKYLNTKGSQKLTVKVTDATNSAFQPRGKQVLIPEGIWYTRVSGIWQSVWIEALPEAVIESYHTTADLGNGTLTVHVTADDTKDGDIIKAELLDGKVGYDTENPSSTVISSAFAVPGESLRLNVPKVKTWSPDSPYLYGLRLSVIRNGKVLDKAEGYAAMREISVIKDNSNYKRIALNGKALFNYGPLDQGWWPDGLYTAPTDEALKYDIIKTKDFGFNMIRKHIKVEPARWYYYCDQLGMLVWQDMPSIDDNRRNKWDYSDMNRGTDVPVPEVWKENYYKEWAEIMDELKVFPSIVVWIPFNEAWGQFDTEKVVDFTRAQDDTRLINPSSGGNFRECGDILDLHHYPGPDMWIFESDYVNVLGEYGGIGLPLEGHLWQKDRNWGYIQYKDGTEVTDKYIEYAELLKKFVRKGMSAAVYTQTTDVEGEVNGLLTYDRKVVKLDETRVRKVNQEVIQALTEVVE